MNATVVNEHADTVCSTAVIAIGLHVLSAKNSSVTLSARTADASVTRGHSLAESVFLASWKLHHCRH